MAPTTLFICTVGGTPEPVVATLLHWQPGRVSFVVSKDTEKNVKVALEKSAQAGFPLGPGQYEIITVDDPQSLDACVHAMRKLKAEASKWRSRGEDYETVVDFTGGTKCMSASMALVAHTWRCRFSYVGGTERTKDGVGIVIDGKESVLMTPNPWDSLGYQVIEEAVTLSLHHHYAAAVAILDDTFKRMSSSVAKSEAQAFRGLLNALALWERFEHKEAREEFSRLKARANDLHSALGEDTAHTVFNWIETAACPHLHAILDSGGKANRAWVLDLLANAKRRIEEGRLEDAVARLYRAIETIAQVRLRENHGLENTAKIRVDELPSGLRKKWQSYARDDGTLQLPLRSQYEVLAEYGDPLGSAFKELGLADHEKSALNARNQSILAHGFSPASVKTVNELYTAALRLAGIEETKLPQFPSLKEKD